MIADLLVALTLGWVLTVGAGLTGQSERLCAAIGGTYTPERAPGDVCPGGRWSTIIAAPR